MFIHESVPLTEIRPRKPEYGIKHGSEEMEHDFPLGETRLPFQMLLRSRKFPLERLEKSRSIYFPSRVFGNVL